jgi:hypothetical protein
MKKAKSKTPEVAQEPEPDFAQRASELRDSFLNQGFTSEQAFQLTMLVLSKSLIFE